ncbi:accessory Sec system protein translocase subunit SecY2 [Lapidilactobacillus wuchangensis]|uniref:accessory Sec system protein translocase subunit SecY2 n=1 Tax=Lapidilactobacillus wuchangensis TaxID=2486001 RepID=UPI000F78658D|nr:accessory Sec system protein translocase subunit SecY2 [Lapidilactobacillus wuchangensis]
MHRYRELITGLGWTAFILAVFTLGQTIPLPGIDLTDAQDALGNVTFMQLFANMTGSNYQMPTLFSVGLGPFMSSMIIWQAVQVIGDEKVSRLTPHQLSFWKYSITIVLAIVQAFQLVYYIRDAIKPFYLWGTTINIAFPVVLLILVAGAIFVTWLADLNASRGIGNTTALIIPGIVRGVPNALQNGFGGTDAVRVKLTTRSLEIAAAIVLVYLIFIVIINAAELRIPVERPMLEGSHPDSYLPIKLLTAGGMPFMFSGSLFKLPQYFINPTLGPTTAWQHFLTTWFSRNTPQGVLSYGVILLLLSYAFGYMNIQPTKLAKDLKESGDYIVGVYPGEETERYIVHHFNLLSFVGNLIIILIGVGPLIIGLYYPPAANYSALLGSVMILVGICSNVGDQVRSLWNKNRYRIFD